MGDVLIACIEDLRFCREDSLYYNILYTFKNGLVIYALLSECLPEGCQGPLATHTICIGVGVCNEVGVELIERVIGQMGELILFLVATHYIVVLACCKTGKAIFKDIQPQWVDGSKRHIHPQVKFEAIEQQGIVDVLTHDVRSSLLGDFSKLISDYDAFALTRCGRLGNPELLFIFLHLDL